MNSIVCLMATRPSLDLMSIRSVPTIKTQTRPPELLVIVFDKRPARADEIVQLRQLAHNVPITILHNQQSLGAAGCWNTGIHWVEKHYPASYIAILDDDDTWDENHLETCWEKANQQKWPDIVISGIRRHLDGKIYEDKLPTRLTPNDFLIGNPGWQGSNTFVRTKTLTRVGGFTNGLRSCNDRDLAIRLMETPGIKVAFTRRHTATWYCNERPEALSAPGSSAKLEGLAHFLHIHQHRMNSAQKQAFFQRCERLFQLTQEQIIHRMSAISST